MDANEMKKLVGFALIDAEIRHLPKDRPARLGLGTGSTAIWAIRRLGELVKEFRSGADGAWKAAGLQYDPVCVCTSFQAQLEAQKWQLEVTDLNDPRIDGQVDLAFDGADEVNPQGGLIKGGGAAHAREKLVEHNAGRFVVLVDESKMVEVLGQGFAVPVEVMPLALRQVHKALEAFGAEVKLREGSGKVGPVITDNGLMILDARFPQGLKAGTDLDPMVVEMAIKSLPGVLDIGLFSCPVAAVYVGRKDGSVEVRNFGPVR